MSSLTAAQHGEHPHDSQDPWRRVAWAHGHLRVQRRGAMLAPVVFQAAGHPDFAPLHLPPWADTPAATQWGGLLEGLRGEWPCVPFGRTDRPDGLPPGWIALTPDDPWGHGFASHHDWQWLDSPDPLTLCLALTPPDTHPAAHLLRTVRAQPDSTAVDITLRITVRRPCTLPVALHPTLSLGQGRVHLDIAHRGPGLTYPVPAEPGHSRLQPNAVFSSLAQTPTADGGTTDLRQFPQAHDSEELLQLQGVTQPVQVHWPDQGWCLTLDWDRTVLPDLILWISHRGRQYAPWNGQHMALGLEPVNGVFDLGRVAQPPAGHPLAERTGLRLHPDQPVTVRYRLSARPNVADPASPALAGGAP